MRTGNGGPPRAAADPVRARIAAATIDLVGTRGYAQTSIEMVCEQARTRRSHFDRCFASKEDCFLCVHDELAAEFCERVHSSYSGLSSWHDRIWAAGWAAMRFLAEDPTRARFLVVEVNGTGNGAQARRDQALQRLADILDGGREELEKPDSVSRCTAEIVAGAIYGTVLGKVEDGCIERGEDFLPELVYMAVMPYLGSRAAEDELLVQSLR
ncbi:MAG TPA: TetR/AcrR family transcriptional regulator [Solirubrobacterales bacterium]|nr:TetR/AcrR family transcriptional regulator [Solirubrobacterales bacterium]